MMDNKIPLKIKAKRILATIALTGSLSLLASNAAAADLAIQVKRIEPVSGHLLIALYQGKENYSSGKNSISRRVKVGESEQQVVFTGLKEGDYAVTMFHDANDNNTMDKNMFGIPKEGYGFSNDAGSMGRPDYEDAKFDLNENKSIVVNLK